MTVEIRRFQEGDAAVAAKMIARTLRISNAADYSVNYIEKLTERISPSWLIQKAQATHFYVVNDGRRLIGTGAIGPYWEQPREYSLFTIFIDPEYQGRGVGRQLIDTLEADVYFKRARRVEVPASKTAHDFYCKMGYRAKNNNDILDDEGLYRLEKWCD